MKYLFNTGCLYIGEDQYGLTNLQVDELSSEIDLTDSASGGYKEYGSGIKGFSFSLEMFRDVDDVKIKTGLIYTDVLMDFGENLYYGDIVFYQITEAGSIDNAVKLKVNGKFTGAVYKIFEQIMRNSGGREQTIWLDSNTDDVPDYWSYLLYRFEQYLFRSYCQ